MITSLYYSTPEQIQLTAILADGRTVLIPEYPSDTPYDAKIQAYLDAGGIIEPYSKPLAQAQGEKLQAIDQGYSDAEATPVNIGGIDFDAGSDDQSEVLAILVRVDHGDTLPGGFTWPDSLGNDLPSDITKMVTLFKAINTKHYVDRNNHTTLKKRVMAATTVAEVEAIPDW